MKLKSLFFLILVVLLAFPEGKALEQKTSHQTMIDSLDQVIEKMDDNIEKVRLLNEFARYSFFNQEIKEAFTAVREAKKLTEDLDYKEGRIMYFLSLSIFNGTIEMAAYYQKKADWLSERTDEEPPAYEMYLSPAIGELEWTIDMVQELDSLLPLFIEEDDKELRANIYWYMAVGHNVLSNTEETISNLKEAIKIFKEIDELYPVILAARFQMLFLNSQGKEDEAKEVERVLVDLVAKSKNNNRLAFITSAMGDNYASSGRFALAIEYYLKSLEEAERVGDLELVANIQLDLGTSYESLELNNKAVDHYKKGISTTEDLGDSVLWKYANGVIVFPLIALGEYEQAQKYMRRAADETLDYSLQNNQNHFLLARYFDAQGQLLMKRGQYAEAIQYFQKAYNIFQAVDGFDWALPFMKLYLAECYFKTGQFTKAIDNGLACFDLTNQTRVTAKASLLLSDIYAEIDNLALAYKYSKMHIAIKTEVEELDERNRLADAEIRAIIDKSQSQIEDLEKANIKNEQERQVQRIWILSITGALLSVLILTVVLYRNNKNKQLANTLLKQQKEEIESTLKKLEATQSQLIQSEKMASLGELTAGIAHEIQNPLNFVNNFSDLSKELVSELEAEYNKGNLDEVKELSADLKDNLSKIHHHGERASSIVKGMLQHSRTGSGEKEPTDINAMADEYLRLAYHGLRAKDKSFNADFELNLDENLSKVDVVPQDIGRVLLNLINNAFYACAEHSRSAEASGKESAEKSYKPLVTVKTKAQPVEKTVQITVSDNGPGIPEDIKDKIFQPFFTTKATGEGTGLGLSMSYDIITKGHGGELNVQSKIGHGTEFIIILPAN